jgi:GDP-mannose 6-dehydrogenase
MDSLKISIFGLGYVGAVTGACLAKLGNRVIGVDVNPVKSAMINEGKSPIIEGDLPELMAEVASTKMFKATIDAAEAVRETDVSLICVGTPSRPNGNLDLTYVRRICAEIGEALRSKSTYHLIVVRSTMLPGSTDDVVIPGLEAASGKKMGSHFGVCYNPEFMREGSSIYDFLNPSMTVIGGTKQEDVNKAASLYRTIDAPLIRTSIPIAEAVKYVCNAYHALKIAFANEIGSLCKGLSIDSHEVMRAFCLDRKLNISDAYLKPGFAFGGSCLPKDLRALSYKAKELDLEVPLLNSIMPANRTHIQRVLELVYQFKKKKIGILGLSFKAGTDDLRESPMVALVETLIGKGFQVRIYDRNVSLARLMGANKEFIEKEIPHISSIMVGDIEEIIAESEIIIIGNAEEEFRVAISKWDSRHIIIDLARLADAPDLQDKPFTYHGICW